MELWEWLILASMFGVGGVFGFAYGRSKADDYTKARKLEQSLSETQQQFDDYREEVSTHFGKTADLFNQLTSNYKAVFEHLAVSSQALCGDQAAKLTAEMPTERLTDSREGAAQPPSAPAAKAEVSAPATAAVEESAASTAQPEAAAEPASAETETPVVEEEAPAKSTIEKAVESQASSDEAAAAVEPNGGESQETPATAKTKGSDASAEDARTLH